MLGRQHDGVDSQRLALIAVFDGNLALGIGSQVSHHLALFADTSKFQQEDMCQRDGQRHVFTCLIAGIAEHHALVAGTLLLLFLSADPLIDVAALAVDGREYGARFSLELVLAFGVTYFLDDVADGLLNVDPPVAGHLAAHNGKTGGHHRLAGHMTLRVAAEEFIEQSIGNLVGHFVGMAFGNTL